MTSLWDKIKKNTLDCKIRRAKRMAQLDDQSETINDFQIDHKGWTKDAKAANPNYAVMVKEIVENLNKKQILELNRRRKLAGKEPV